MKGKAHRAGEGGGEHDGLAVGADVVDDAHDLRLKAHVKHAVRLVHDQVRHAAQIGDLAAAGRQQINHAPGCADHHLNHGQTHPVMSTISEIKQYFFPLS